MEEDTSSHPYYVRAECKLKDFIRLKKISSFTVVPFVFIPARDFTFASSHLGEDDEEQMTSEIYTEKKTTAAEEEGKSARRKKKNERMSV